MPLFSLSQYFFVFGVFWLQPPIRPHTRQRHRPPHHRRPAPAPMPPPAPTPPPRAHSPAPTPPSPAPLPHTTRPRPSTARSRVGGGSSAAAGASASARAALARAQSPPAHCSTPECCRPRKTWRIDSNFLGVQVCCEPCGAAPPGAAATGGERAHSRECDAAEAARQRQQPPATCNLGGRPPTEG